MQQPERKPNCSCTRIRQRLALNILLDEFAIAALSDALSVLRAADAPDVAQIEEAIRTHRIGILKQRVILGAAGIEPE